VRDATTSYDAQFSYLIFARNESHPLFSSGKDEYEEEGYDISHLEGRSHRPPELVTLPHCYKDGSSIDWLYEEAAERERRRQLNTLHGLRGLLTLALNSAQMWMVIIATGIGIGVIGAWLDVLVKW
jgi:chloride channel 3/4/5